VTIGALLTTTTIPLIKWSLQAINDAGSIGEQTLLDKGRLNAAAHALNRSEVEVTRALSSVEAGRVKTLQPAEVKRIAADLNVTPDAAARAFADNDVNRRALTTPQMALHKLGLICLAVVGL